MAQLAPTVQMPPLIQLLVLYFPLYSFCAQSDIIFLDDSDFVKPNAASNPRKKPKICSVNDTRPNDGSMLLFSPQCTKSPGNGNKRVALSVYHRALVTSK